MASIIIRNLDTALKRKLSERAAQHGCSIEDEVRTILQAALAENAPAPTNLFDAIRRHVAPLGGVDLKIPRRGAIRKPPTFSDA
jgi:plasmid stability protein